MFNEDDQGTFETGAPVDVVPSTLETLGEGQGAEVTTRENAAHAADLAHQAAVKRFERRHAGDKLSSARLTASANQARRDGGKSQETVAEGPARTGKNIVIIVGAAIAVLLLLVALVSCVSNLVNPKTDQPAEQPPAEEPADEQTSDQPQTNDDGSVTVGGLTYSLAQVDGSSDAAGDGTGGGESTDGGESAGEGSTEGEGGTDSGDSAGDSTGTQDATWALMSAPAGFEPSQVFALDGEPATLLVHGSDLVIPQSLTDGTWDVVAYTPGSGSGASKLTAADGTEVSGSGSIASASLDGSTLTVVDSNGVTTTFNL